MSTTQTWERREDESGKAWTAFCAYRNLGVHRSIDKAWRALNGIPQEDPRTAPRHWTTWCSGYEWVERAEAYDAHLERISRSEREAEHFAELEAFRYRQKRLAQSTLTASIALLDKINKRLKHLQADDIPVKSLPQFYRALAAVTEAATNSEAQAIAVTELLGLLDAERDG